MTTFTNSEGLVITYTNELLETMLLQLNSKNNYYTSGEHDIIFTNIGSNRTLILDCTYSINRNLFQNYTINENLINTYDLEFILNGTSNEYDLPSVYIVNGIIVIITELQQVFLAIYDTGIIPCSHTGSETIDITDNQIPLNFPMQINDEVVLNPRAYDGAVVDMLSGTDNFAFQQNPLHGGTLITQCYSSTK